MTYSVTYTILNTGLFILAVICTIAVYANKFDDRLFQRLGLILTAIGCYLLLYARWQMHGPETEVRIRILVTTGIVVYAVATFIKVWKQK